MDKGYVVLLAFLAESVGLGLGFVGFYLFNITNKRLIGMLYGATSGIMIAMICFDILPEALATGEQVFVMCGVGLGICLGLSLEDMTEIIKDKFRVKKRDKGRKVGRQDSLGKQSHKELDRNIGIILLIGIAIHSFPEGFALGTISISAPESLHQLAIITCLHSIPEAIALAVPFKLMRVSYQFVVATPLMIGSVMGLGALVGLGLTQTVTFLVPVALGGATGIILYIVCEELLPESRKMWNGRMTSVATIVGIIVGMFIVK